jgi:hypothetical protein
MKLKLLLSLMIACTLYSQDQLPQQQEQTPNTAQSILDITKDILKSGTGMIKSAVGIGKRFYKRARQEAGYFGEELKSFIQSDKEIIARQTVHEIADQYEALLITMALDTLSCKEIEQLVTACAHPMDLTQLQQVLISLNPSISCNLNVTFVQQLRIISIKNYALSKSPTCCTLTFRIKRPNKLYQWVDMIEQYRHFEQSMPLITKRDEYYASLLTLVAQAHQKNLLYDIVVS